MNFSLQLFNYVVLVILNGNSLTAAGSGRTIINEEDLENIIYFRVIRSILERKVTQNIKFRGVATILGLTHKKIAHFFKCLGFLLVCTSKLITIPRMVTGKATLSPLCNESLTVCSLNINLLNTFWIVLRNKIRLFGIAFGSQ